MRRFHGVATENLPSYLKVGVEPSKHCPPPAIRRTGSPPQQGSDPINTNCNKSHNSLSLHEADADQFGSEAGGSYTPRPRTFEKGGMRLTQGHPSIERRNR
jgi:hypothetical protein